MSAAANTKSPSAERLPAERLLGQAGAFAAQLAQWFAQHRRILPWREAPSAYKTVVSELMLQQTQVVTALPYFERWIARWPDFASLAAAGEAEVLQMWEGLGYYTRARNLLKLARAWVEAEEKPVTAVQWLAYPGVGPYTAAAIASIAFNEHSAVVDGNVVRILARLSADDTDWPSAAHAVKALTPLAQGIIARAENPGLHNEAMMELGATLCRKGQPQCLLCPVEKFCEGRSLGQAVDTLPRIARKKTEERLVNRAFVVDRARNAVLLHRYSGTSRRLAGLCELPLWQDVACIGAPAEGKVSAAPAVGAARVEHAGGAVSAVCGLPENSHAHPPVSQKPLLVRRRGIANERIEERFYALDAAAVGQGKALPDVLPQCGRAGAGNAVNDRTAGTGVSVADGGGRADSACIEGEGSGDSGGLFWQSLDALDAVTLTGPHRRWLVQLLAG